MFSLRIPVIDRLADADGAVEGSAAALREARAKVLSVWEAVVVHTLRMPRASGTSTEPCPNERVDERATANGGLHIQVYRGEDV